MPAPDAASQIRTRSKATVRVMPDDDITPLYCEFYAQLRRWTAARVGSVEEAEDIVQNAFLTLCNSGGTSRVKGDVEAYLFGVTRRLAARYLRQRLQRPKTTRLGSIGDLQAAPQSDRSRVQVDQIRRLLERLPPKAREAIRLRYLEGMRPREAARRVGCSENVFYQRVHSGIENLRASMQRGARSAEATTRDSNTLPV